MMRRQLDDPEFAVSLVSVFFVFDVIFNLLGLLTGFIGNSDFILSNPVFFLLLPLLLIGLQVLVIYGLLKKRRWAWPAAFVVIGLTILGSLLAFSFFSILRIALYGFLGWLLLRPAVRARVGFGGR